MPKKNSVLMGFNTFFCSAALTALIFLYGSIWTETSIANSRESSIISLSGSTESWTQKWRVTESDLVSSEGLKAGFYRQIPPTLNVKLPGGRHGIVCIFPISRYKPARMTIQNLKITNQNIVLVAKVAAAKFPRGRWEFMLKFNDLPFMDPVIINGNDGWQDMVFDLSSYLGRIIDIEIEARTIGSGRNSSVFIDYIGFTGLDGKEKSELTSIENDYTDEAGKPFDDAYMMFLEILLRNEEIRHYRIMDRQYIDSYYNKSGRKVKKESDYKGPRKK